MKIFKPLLGSILLSPLFGDNVIDFINWAEALHTVVRGLIMIIDSLMLIIAESMILASSFVNQFRYYLQTEFLSSAMGIMFNAIGFSPEGKISGLFVLTLVIAIGLVGFGYVVSIFFPNSGNWVNKKNIVIGIVVSVALVTSSFSILSNLEKMRTDLYSGVSGSVMSELINPADDPLTKGLQADTTLVPVCAESLTQPQYTLCNGYDIDSMGDSPLGAGSLNSSTDLAGALIGMNDGSVSFGMLPRFETMYLFPPSDTKNQTQVDDAITNRYTKSMGVAFMGVIVALVGVLESVALVLLDMTGLLLFLAIPLAIVFSYFQLSQNLFSSLIEKYLQLVMATAIIGAFMPLMSLLGFKIGGFFAYALVGFLVWGVAILMSFQTASGAFSFAMNGLFGTVGLPGVTGSVGQVAKTALNAAGTAVGLAGAIGTGGASLLAAGLGKAATDGSKALGAMANVAGRGSNIGRTLSNMSDDASQTAAAYKRASKIIPKAGMTLAGAALGKTNVGKVVGALSAFASDPNPLNVGESLEYSDASALFLAGSTMANSGLMGTMMAGSRLKRNAMNNLKEKALEDGDPNAVETLGRLALKGRSPSSRKGGDKITNGEYFAPTRKVSESIASKLDNNGKLTSSTHITDGVAMLDAPTGASFVNSNGVMNEIQSGITGSEDNRRDVMGRLEAVMGSSGAKSTWNLANMDFNNPELGIDKAMESYDVAVQQVAGLPDSKSNTFFANRVVGPNGKPTIPSEIRTNVRNVVKQKMVAGNVKATDTAAIGKIMQEAQMQVLRKDGVSESDLQVITDTAMSNYGQFVSSGALDGGVSQSSLQVVQSALDSAIRRTQEQALEQGVSTTMLFRDGSGNLSNNTPLWQNFTQEVHDRGASHLLVNSKTEQDVRNAVAAMTTVRNNISNTDIIFDIARANQIGMRPTQYIQEKRGITDESMREIGSIITYFEQNPEPRVAPVINSISNMEPNDQDRLYEVIQKYQGFLSTAYANGNTDVENFLNPDRKDVHITSADNILREMSNQRVLDTDDLKVIENLSNLVGKSMGIRKAENMRTARYTLMDVMRQMGVQTPVRINGNGSARREAFDNMQPVNRPVQKTPPPSFDIGSDDNAFDDLTDFFS